MQRKPPAILFLRHKRLLKLGRCELHAPNDLSQKHYANIKLFWALGIVRQLSFVILK